MDSTIKRRRYKDNPYVIINRENMYFINFIDSKNKFQEIEVNSKIYEVFNQSELHDLSELNEYDRHIEHSELFENELYQRRFTNYYSLEEEVETSIMREELYNAINKLPDIQKRRIVKYYFEHKTEQQIAKEENSTQQSVHIILDRAIENLKKLLKNKI